MIKWEQYQCLGGSRPLFETGEAKLVETKKPNAWCSLRLCLNEENKFGFGQKWVFINWHAPILLFRFINIQI